MDDVGSIEHYHIKEIDMQANIQPATNAIALIKADHDEVFAMLEKFEKGGTHKETKHNLAKEICQSLKIHAQLEEEILYPTLRENIDKQEMMQIEEALVEHGAVKDLIAKIEMGSPEELFEAQVRVLGKLVTQHVQEEESILLPKLKASIIDLNELGRQLADRKQELQTGLLGQAAAWVKSKINQLSSPNVNDDDVQDDIEDDLEEETESWHEK